MLAIIGISMFTLIIISWFIWFVLSWYIIIKFDIFEGQKENGFWFSGVYRELWDEEELTEFGKIILSIIFTICLLFVLTGSLLILKPLFVKNIKGTK